MLTQNTTQSQNHADQLHRMLQDKFNTITTNKLVTIPMEYREEFVGYCQARNVYPCGGAINDDNTIQHFYLD